MVYQCIIVVHGPAGSGKTTFTGKFERWANENLEVKFATVNFDPAVMRIPYKPIFDIRDYVTAKEVMEKYNLGPNGGIMRAVEESRRYLNDLFKAIEQANADYILLDTPGIMEVFVGRDIGRSIIDELIKKYIVLGFHIMDSSAVTKASEYVYFKSLFILSGLKLGIQSVPIWNKIDIASKTFREIRNLTSKQLREKLECEPGLYTEAAVRLSRLSAELEAAVRETYVDSISGKGFNDVYDVLHELFCTCGDLT